MSEDAAFTHLHPECVRAWSFTQHRCSCSVSFHCPLFSQPFLITHQQTMLSGPGSKYRHESERPNAADTDSASSSQLLFVPTAPLCCCNKRVREARDCNKCINMKSRRGKSSLAGCLWAQWIDLITRQKIIQIGLIVCFPNICTTVSDKEQQIRNCNCR